MLEFYAENRATWRQWLTENHDRVTGVWLIYNKKGSGQPHLPYDEAVEEALCFGWVDSKPGKVDAVRSRLYFAPRKPGSGWSAPNKARIERLTAAGLMMPAGLDKVAAAQADGSWSMLDGVEALEIPSDLLAALRQYPQAEVYFNGFPRSVKRGILEWILQAKRPETRAKRIAETAQLASQNQRANQWNPKAKDVMLKGRSGDEGLSK